MTFSARVPDGLGHQATDTFLESFAQVRTNKKVLTELGKKLARLSEDPLHVGGWLSGSLHGMKSTRIAKRYRLIFLPDEREQIFT